MAFAFLYSKYLLISSRKSKNVFGRFEAKLVIFLTKRLREGELQFSQKLYSPPLGLNKRLSI